MSNISFEEFRKLDLRVGKVISAEKIIGSTNLLKLEIDLGDPSTGSGLGKRQILAGVSKYYESKELIGLNLVIVTNLEPKKIMGLESQGMILCAEVNEEPVCLVPLKDVPPGSKVL
ncbi:MAG TPA: methionine--tRNA ligase [Candidatus Nanoarchaeia archaeon]